MAHAYRVYAGKKGCIPASPAELILVVPNPVRTRQTSPSSSDEMNIRNQLVYRILACGYSYHTLQSHKELFLH